MMHQSHEARARMRARTRAILWFKLTSDYVLCKVSLYYMCVIKHDVVAELTLIDLLMQP